jgi:hypothetical protein
MWLKAPIVEEREDGKKYYRGGGLQSHSVTVLSITIIGCTL